MLFLHPGSEKYWTRVLTLTLSCVINSGVKRAQSTVLRLFLFFLVMTNDSYQSSALLVLTNQQGISHLEATRSWKVLALREDQLKAEQILFLDQTLGVISHLAFLSADQPFTSIKLDKDAPVLYLPNVCHVEECFELIGVQTQLLDFIDKNLFSGSLALNHEAATIDDLDDLYIGDSDTISDILGSEIVDQLITNGRSFTQTVAMRYVTESASVSLAQELEDHGSKLPGSRMKELPEAWAAMGAGNSTLALLNSAFRP